MFAPNLLSHRRCVFARSCGPCQSISGTSAVAYLYDSSLNVAGYVANDNGQAIVSFRGTEPSSLQVCPSLGIFLWFCAFCTTWVQFSVCKVVCISV
jgi:hypothetical protein